MQTFHHLVTNLGIPFSTKEGIKVKGMRHSYGSPIRKNVRAKQDAEAVTLLRRVGNLEQSSSKLKQRPLTCIP